MPEICRFLGMVITMYFGDHGPPHFHVRFGEMRAVILIDTVEVDDSDLPRRQEARVMEWATLRQAELQDRWRRIQRGESYDRIDPLP